MVRPRRIVRLQDAATAQNRQRRVTDAVNKIEAGLVPGNRPDLEELARICFEQGWIDELLRVRHALLNV